MSTVGSFFDFAAEFGGVTRDEFLSRVRVPHLYFPNLPGLEGAKGFTTIRITPGVVPTEAGNQGIVAIEKDGGANAFGMMVTMGRAANNDLVVPDTRVSKFHGFFQPAGDGWSFTDARSTNGTTMEGVPLVPHTTTPVPSGATLELSGSIAVRFLMPMDLYAFLHEPQTVGR